MFHDLSELKLLPELKSRESILSRHEESRSQLINTPAFFEGAPLQNRALRAGLRQSGMGYGFLCVLRGLKAARHDFLHPITRKNRARAGGPASQPSFAARTPAERSSRALIQNIFMRQLVPPARVAT